MRLRTILTALFLLALPIVAAAQSAAPTAYQIQYYAVGAPAPLQQSDVFTTAAITCNQVRPTTTNTVNPTRAIWTDPAAPTRVCIYTAPAVGAALFALPVGAYEATLIATNPAGASAESNRAPFSRVALPDAPAGFGLTR